MACTINLKWLLIIPPINKLGHFVTVSHLYPSIVFSGKAASLPLCSLAKFYGTSTRHREDLTSNDK